ncbi:MAG: T9SS type A sorting domain-containing protein [Crocinitomicaceae bacterium]|nr:T9SS type A sorting domain-containing protein [Crocinitomicaceae bacterium]
MQTGTVTLQTDADCGASFYDEGGSATSGSASNTITICPPSADSYVRVTFSLISYNDGGNPSHQDNFEYSIDGATYYELPDGATGYIQSDIGTCLNIRFTQNGNTNSYNFSAIIDCINNVPNDDPCGALQLSGFSTCNYISVDNDYSTQTVMSEPSCGGGSLYPENDVWYSIVVPSDGSFDLTFSQGTITDAAAAVYSSSDGTCNGTFTEISCNDDDGSGLMPAISVTSQNPGDTLWIRLWDYGGDQYGNFEVCATFNTSQDCSNPTTNDCQGAMPLCSNSPVSDLASGQGCVADLNSSNDGCLAGEHNTSWFYIMIDDPGDGTWGFDGVFDVGSNGIEYDWALWEATGDPTITSFPCTNLGTPIRCSYASQTGKSEVAMGMNASDTDLSENSSPSGNGYTYWLDNVQQGDIYILMVDRYSTAGGAFDLNFIGGATMDCSITEPPVVLPVEYTNIYGKAIEQTNLISWTTEQEVHNDFFTLQKSTNGTLWSSIGTVDGAGNSSVQNSYRFLDTENINGLRYYRIKQTDFNGLEKISEPIVVSNTNFDPFGTIFPNPVINEFSIEYSGDHLNSTYNLSIVDEMGRVLKVFNTMLKHDNNFSVSELNRGVYSVILKATDGTFYRRILID